MSQARVAVPSSLLSEPGLAHSDASQGDWTAHRLTELFELIPIGLELKQILSTRPPGSCPLDPAQTIKLFDNRMTTPLGEPLQRWTEIWLDSDQARDLDGILLPTGTLSAPSHQSGSGEVQSGSAPAATDRFAATVMKRLPLLPIEAMDRIQDPELRELFVTRVLAKARLRNLFESKWTWSQLIDFHSREKTLLLAHCPATLKVLGALVAKGPASCKEVADNYPILFMEALQVPSSRGKHANALNHLAGFFKRRVSDEGRRSVAQIIESYRLGRITRKVPLNLIRRIGTEHHCAWLLKQSYLYLSPNSEALEL